MPLLTIYKIAGHWEYVTSIKPQNILTIETEDGSLFRCFEFLYNKDLLMADRVDGKDNRVFPYILRPMGIYKRLA